MTDRGASGSLGVYVAYGLYVRSDLPLPELQRTGPIEPAADVEVRLLDAAIPDNPTEPSGSVAIDDDITMLWWSHVGRFIVTGGEDICVAMAPRADPARLRMLLLGPVFVTLLRQRGWFPLHAAAVDTGGRAVAILGGSPSEIDALGLPVIAHDTVAVQFGAHDVVPQVRPLHSRLAPPCVGAATDAAPLPLDAIYLVEPGDDPVEPRDAFMALFERMLDEERSLGAMTASAFRFIGRLATAVPVRRLQRATLRERDLKSIIAG